MLYISKPTDHWNVCIVLVFPCIYHLYTHYVRFWGYKLYIQLDVYHISVNYRIYCQWKAQRICRKCQVAAQNAREPIGKVEPLMW